ncbi:hypothetical protein FHG87_019145 [Trinorchestia longiramus]|nr:hypothetical protein FHG87_019145 [Trinorchestia longiramus]
MGKKTSFQRVQPLTDATYADLDTIGRCVHFDDFEEAHKKGFLVPQPLSNSHTRLSQKVLWFAPCQPMSCHNYYGNVTFVIKWETVQQSLGPYLYLIDQAIYNSRSFTRVVFTRNRYTNLTSVDLDSNESPMIKSWKGFQHATYCMNKHRHGAHELQIGIEVNEAESRWLLQNCSPMANDHSLANTPFTGNHLRKSGANYKYESYRKLKFYRGCTYRLINNLQRLELKSLEQRRLRGQIIETFKYLNGLNNVTLEGLFERDGNVRTRNNGQKLLLRNFKTSQAMNFFPVKIAVTWNQLPENIVSAGTVNTFKNRLDKFWITNPPVLNPTNHVPNSLRLMYD